MEVHTVFVNRKKMGEVPAPLALVPHRGLGLLFAALVIQQVNWGALAIEPKDAAISQSATTWPYPQPPFDWHIDDLWAFIGTHTINGSYPPDNVPDPAITYGSQPYPSSITISRNRKSLWGDWDQVLIVGASGSVGTGPRAGRITQAFSSATPPTLPSYPEHVPHRLARFDWTHRSDGATDLTLYSPPKSSFPIFRISGLRRIPYVSFPVGRNFFSSLGISQKFLQSVVDSYEPVGPIKGHVFAEVAIEGTGGISLYSSFETSDALDLDGGFFNVGFAVENGTVTASIAPYSS